MHKIKIGLILSFLATSPLLGMRSIRSFSAFSNKLSQSRTIPRLTHPFVQRSLLKTATASQKNSYKSSSNFKSFWQSKARFVLPVAAAGWLYAHSQAQCQGNEEQTIDPYNVPYEEKDEYAYLKARPWGALAEKYMAELKAEEESLMQKFFKEHNITKQQWEELKRREWPNYLKAVKKYEEYFRKELATLPEDSYYVQIIHQELKNAGFNPKEFRILINEHLLGVGYRNIYINPDLFEAGKNEKKNFLFSVRHEIAHIKNKDYFITYLLQQLLHLHKTSWIEKRSQFKEKRADVFAALEGKLYSAQGVKVFKESLYNQFMEHYPISTKALTTTGEYYFANMAINSCLEFLPSIFTPLVLIPFYTASGTYAVYQAFKMGIMANQPKTHPYNTVRAGYVGKLHAQLLETTEGSKWYAKKPTTSIDDLQKQCDPYNFELQRAIESFTTNQRLQVNAIHRFEKQIKRMKNTSAEHYQQQIQDHTATIARLKKDLRNSCRSDEQREHIDLVLEQLSRIKKKGSHK